MADIIMCDGKGCSRKSFCDRYTADPSVIMQSYFSTVPIANTLAYCEHFIRNNVGVPKQRRR